MAESDVLLTLKEIFYAVEHPGASFEIQAMHESDYDEYRRVADAATAKATAYWQAKVAKLAVLARSHAEDCLTCFAECGLLVALRDLGATP